MEPLLGFNEETIEKTSSGESSGYKLVPWLSWNEWEWVRDSLFSNSPQETASAIARISTWRSRGCLPVVIDVTASIIEIQQKDPFYRKDLPSDALHSEQMLAMLYCMAILRLVNCVVEKTRKKTEISIAEAAGAIGIPRTLIDIRHEGSHRDLPALTLVRDSAVKAIHWLKSYYWEPQTEQIPFRMDETAKVRKQVKIKLQELALCLRVQGNQSGSSPVKGHKHKDLPCGRNKFFSIMSSKLNSSKSGGLKNQTTKTLKTLVRLYSSYSSEVLSVLFELILEALDSSSLSVYPNQDSQEMQTLLDDWKPVIVKLSNKEPELLLTLLKAILNTIETQEALKYQTGTYCAPIESRAGTDRIEQLSSLFAWLVGKLKLLKQFRNTDGKSKTEASAAEMNMSSQILMEVLKKCLVLSSYGNKGLMDSAMDLANLVGNSRLMEKLIKLGSLGLSDSDISEENCSRNSSSKLLIQQDQSIHEAAKKLEFIKLNLAKRRIVNSKDADLGGGGRWAVAKSWNPCPIGTLPRDLGSSGRVPVLDHHYVDKEEFSNPSERTWELKRFNVAEEPGCHVHSDGPGVERSKREASSDICLLDSSSVKKMRNTVESCESGDEDGWLPADIHGCLMIDGVWKTVKEDELLAIKSGVGNNPLLTYARLKHSSTIFIIRSTVEESPAGAT